MPRINPSALNTQVPWCPSSIRTILRNERYRGHVVWDKTVKVRSKSGKRIYKRIAPEKWVVREVPDQRIVSDQLWASAQARTEIVKQIYGEIGSKEECEGDRPVPPTCSLGC